MLPEGVPEPALGEDARLARERGLKFEVVSKSGRGRGWETVAAGVEDLVEAVALAARVRAYESGVLVVYPGGGLVYWTSLYPDLLNSTVLHAKFNESE